MRASVSMVPNFMPFLLSIVTLRREPPTGILSSQSRFPLLFEDWLAIFFFGFESFQLSVHAISNFLRKSLPSLYKNVKACQQNPSSTPFYQLARRVKRGSAAISQCTQVNIEYLNGSME